MSEPAVYSVCSPAELSVRCDGDGMESLPPDIPVPVRRREPKFVPYEPYKAAVTPMVPPRTQLAALEIPFPLHHPLGGEPPLLAVVREVPEGTPPAPSEAPLEQRLRETHQCNQDLQEQLRVQVEVNRELKKLLVASVGEDLEARVHFLSEDKAQLAADVRAYAQRLSQGREEIDRLAIHADVWRSKFLAASLLVDELASCKARLMRQCDDFQEALQWMASEHQQLEANLTATCRLLAKLQGEAPKEPAPCDVLQLSAQAQRVARSLCHQAAPRGGSANLRLGPSPVVCATPAETFARRTDRAYESLKCSFTSSAHSALESSITSSNECVVNGLQSSTIACCRHCSGHLETV
ncbi:golgin-45-like isoform X1 [Dermacentor silvarum]|uniref:golgin-45-like isoform X1 n=1 Tax=Dermacentor silvarum TaxID=543639 RepID=UPI0021011547|nr:golgin-45-like isoform X1 [Dermacentor silvarum]